jgi:16S rRNA (uracil1498-N3)-methyltransferase
VWLPVLHDPIPFDQINKWKNKTGSLFIAHCELTDKKHVNTIDSSLLSETMIAIGPEGDFTKDEIALAEKEGFSSVGLGDTRLRTETAAIVAISLLRLG